jgi:hypothetical protein
MFMLSRGWFYVSYMLFLVGLIYVVEWFIGNVYARYVLAYTGTIFIAGMLLGQKSERGWNLEQETHPGVMAPEIAKRVEGRKGS